MSTTSPGAELVVVVGSDDNYALGLSMTIASALRNLTEGTRARIIVVDGGITSRSKDRLERVVRQASPTAKVEWHTVDTTLFRGLKTSKWGSTANYLRLLIPEIVGNEVNTVVYLDSDLLIRGDISKLADQGVGMDAAIAAVGDFHHREIRTVFGELACEQLGIDASNPYFNSGVLVVNVDKWREDDIPKKAIEFVRENAGVMRHSDQDALNAILEGEWDHLDDRWNVMLPSLNRFLSLTTPKGEARRRRRAELIEDAHIFHFTGARKPWKPGYWGKGGADYRRLLLSSGWFESRRERFTWQARYWVKSPFIWARLAGTRVRKKMATALHSMRNG